MEAKRENLGQLQNILLIHFQWWVLLSLDVMSTTTNKNIEFNSLSAFCHAKLRQLQNMHEFEYPWIFTLSIIKECLDDPEAKTALRLIKPPNERDLILSERDNENERQLMDLQALKSQFHKKLEVKRIH